MSKADHIKKNNPKKKQKNKKQPGVNANGKQFLFLIRHPSYIQVR